MNLKGNIEEWWGKWFLLRSEGGGGARLLTRAGVVVCYHVVQAVCYFTEYLRKGL